MRKDKWAFSCWNCPFPYIFTHKLNKQPDMLDKAVINKLNDCSLRAAACWFTSVEAVSLLKDYCVLNFPSMVKRLAPSFKLKNKNANELFLSLSANRGGTIVLKELQPCLPIMPMVIFICVYVIYYYILYTHQSMYVVACQRNLILIVY